MVKKRFMLGLAAGALVAAMLPGAALGGGPQVGSCPPGFTAAPLSFLNQYRVGGLQSADLNGNDWTCVRLLATPSDIVFMDDVVKPS